MTAPPAIVDGNLVAGEVTVLDTLLPESQEPTANLPESQEPTANHSSERISPSQPEEMPPRVPPSAEVCGDMPPPKAPAPTRWEALEPIITDMNKQLSYKENIIKSMKEELEEKEKIIKSMGQIIKDRDGIIKHKNYELRLKNDSVRAINEEFEEQQAQVKVWEQEVTIGDDMVIGVVVRKKRRIAVDTS